MDAGNAENPHRNQSAYVVYGRDLYQAPYTWKIHNHCSNQFAIYWLP